MVLVSDPIESDNELAIPLNTDDHPALTVDFGS